MTKKEILEKINHLKQKILFLEKQKRSMQREIDSLEVDLEVEKQESRVNKGTRLTRSINLANKIFGPLEMTNCPKCGIPVNKTNKAMREHLLEAHKD